MRRTSKESDPRYDARTVAAKRARRGRSRDLRQRDPQTGELAGARAARARRPGRRGAAPVRIVDLRGEAAIRSRLRCSPRWGSWPSRGKRPAAQPPGDGARAALPSVWETRRCLNCDVALVLHRDGSSTAIRIRRVDARGLSRMRLGRAGQDRRRDTAARARAGRTPAGARAFPTRRRRGRGAGSAGGHPASLRRRRSRRCSSGLRSSLRATTSPAFRSRP